MEQTYQNIYNFWFKELTPKEWFEKDLELDKTITNKFLSTHKQAVAEELTNWRTTAQGALAEIIVLDQFSRNMFRDTPKAFSYDKTSLNLAQKAIAKGFNKQLEPQERAFLYMPFMHSESTKIHKQAVELFSEKGLENTLGFEMAHKKIIDNFGRYPHRNEILGRESTPEEIEFLQQPNSSF